MSINRLKSLFIGTAYMFSLGLHPSLAAENIKSNKKIERIREISRSLGNATLNSQFGYSISVGSESVSKNANRLVVGAPSYSTNRKGAAFVYNYNGSNNTYSLLATLPTSNLKISDNAQFGFSVSISNDGNIILVGAPYSGAGAAYLFTANNSNQWTGKILPLPKNNFATNPAWGSTVYVSPDGSTAFVGGTEYNDGNGAVLVYNLKSTTLTPVTLIPKNTKKDYNMFGASIASSSTGDTVAIGSMFDGDGKGATFIFKKDSKGAWLENSKLVGTGGSTGDQGQGYTVSMNLAGDVVAVGAPLENNQNGSVWIFNLNSSTGKWSQFQRITETRGSDHPFYASSVSLTQRAGTLVVGSSMAGKVYTYKRNSNTALFTHLAKPLSNTNCSNIGQPVAISSLGNHLIDGASATNPSGATCVFFITNRNAPEGWDFKQKITQ